jgi:hypothetical protein
MSEGELKVSNIEDGETKAMVYKRAFMPEVGYYGLEVGVEINKMKVWSTDVTPHFSSLERIIFLPKPFYPKRIEMSMSKAEKIAEKINRTSD